MALDLGCGPGASTRLLAEVTCAGRTVGVDISTAFLEIASARPVSEVGFVHHDATTVPLPEAPVDLIYCRLLLAHVPDPAATVRAWAPQLTPGGRLLVDEMEWIDASHPVLAAYEAVVLDLLASRGAPMYAGPMVATILGAPGWHQCRSAGRRVSISAPAAARIYELNLTTWRDDPHIREHHSSDQIDALARELRELAESTAADPVVWAVRQVAFERRFPVDTAD